MSLSFRLKKHHGRAEALLIAAWGLGVSIDTNTSEPTFGPMRGCTATDAYGNKVNSSSQAQVPAPDTILQGGCKPMVRAGGERLQQGAVDYTVLKLSEAGRFVHLHTLLFFRCVRTRKPSITSS